MTRARARPAREHVAVIAVRNVERQVGPLAAFAQDLGLLRVGFGKHRLKFIAFGHAAAEHTVSLDHWSLLQFLAIDAARSTSRASPSVERGPRMGSLGAVYAVHSAPAR